MRMRKSESNWLADEQRVMAVVIGAWTLTGIILLIFVFFPHGILDHYLFRQTQAATVIRELAQGGPLLAYRMPLFGPPWTAPLEFPLYQLTSAKLANLTGVNFISTARIVSFASMFATLILLWRGLFVIGASKTVRMVAVFLTVISPAYLYWSSTVMIETFALALSTGFLVCALEYLYRQRLWLLGIGSLLATAAALAKVTTFAVFASVTFVIFALEFLGFAWKNRSESALVVETGLKRFSYGLGLLLPALVIALAWIAFADHIKEQSPLTRVLTSEALKNWNSGTQADRLQNLSYLVMPFRGVSPSIFTQFLGLLWPVPVILAAAGMAIRRNRHLPQKAVALFGFLFGPMLFSNLHEVHYYYWVSGTLFLFILLAYGIDDLIDFLQNRRLLGARPINSRRSASVLIGLAATLVTCSAITFRTFFLERTLEQYPKITAIGEMVQEHTVPDDIIFIFGFNWNPALQYTADRPAVMAWHTQEALDFVAENDVRIDAVLFCREALNRIPEFLASRALNSASWQQSGKAGFCHLYQPAGNSASD